MKVVINQTCMLLLSNPDSSLFIAGFVWFIVKLIYLAVSIYFKNLQYDYSLCTLGRQLEDSGVLNGSLKSRGNSWGLHMPLVCPDGAVVAYAWKRQLAGQAGASAVDRTR